MNEHDKQNIEVVGRILADHPSVLFVTGAGLSADSGLPTYRGVGGLYDVDETEEGFPIEVILSASMFQKNPNLTWKYLLQVGAAAKSASFNRGHEIMAKFEAELPRVWTLTQNIDGYHRDAGSRNLIEIHGNMNSFRCMECRRQFKTDSFEISVEELPNCPNCGGKVRPNVVLFDEMLPEEELNTLGRELETGFGLVMIIGTSAVFPYIKAPIHGAKQRGNPTVEINPGETGLSHIVDYRIATGAKDALEAIWESYQNAKMTK